MITLSERAEFFPNARRARMLDGEVRARLRSSLSYLLDRLSTEVDVPAGIEDVLARLATTRVPPTAFAAYADLVLAIQSGQRADVERLLGYLVRVSSGDQGLALIALRAGQADERLRLYQRYVDTDADRSLILAPLPEAAESRFRSQFAAALTMMDEGCPALALEIRALLQEILLVGKGKDPTFEFDGASAFTLWGGAVLNGEGDPTVLKIVQAVTHESAHSLLFALSLDHPLHRTDRSRRFSSPLRQDARPMEGIIHATFVVARMHLALQQLIGAGVLAGSDLAEAEPALPAHAQDFMQGMSVIRQHAVLTPFGDRLLSSAAHYMATALV